MLPPFCGAPVEVRAAGGARDVCDRLFEEKQSAGSTNRPALQAMLSFVRTDDEVVVHSMNRLARNLFHLLTIIQELNDKGVTI